MTHLAGMTRDIDDGIEALTGQRRAPVGSVAIDPDEPDTVGRGSRDAARRTRHVVTGGPGVRGDRPPQEHRPAEDQETHDRRIVPDGAESSYGVGDDFAGRTS